MGRGDAVTLRWTGKEDVYEGGRGSGPRVTIDSGASAGPSPTDVLLLSLGACMCVDIRMILGKSRVPLDALEVRFEAERAEEPPRRFTRIRMIFVMSGPGPDDDRKVERAIELSRETYCSVFHSLRDDIVIETEVRKG
ncbi:MAG: OsmC family protein [Gemmatimonadota bacterium]